MDCQTTRQVLKKISGLLGRVIAAEFQYKFQKPHSFTFQRLWLCETEEAAARGECGWSENVIGLEAKWSSVF